MPDIYEEKGSKIEKTKGDRTKWSRTFFFHEPGSDYSEVEAYTLFRSFISSRYPVFTAQRIQSLNVNELEDGNGTWRADCSFISPDLQQQLKQEGLPEYTFSTKGGTAHITQSRKTVKKYAGYVPKYEYSADMFLDSGEPNTEGIKTLHIIKDAAGKVVIEKEKLPDFKCGINWNEESQSFDGCEITVPAWKSTVKFTVNNSYLDPMYFRMLRMLTGSVNAKPFDGMSRGECLFLGCDGSRRIVLKEEGGTSGEPEYEIWWDLSFEFTAQPNVKKWIDNIGYIKKNGWDYLHLLRRQVDLPFDAEFVIPDKPDDIDPDLDAGYYAAPMPDVNSNNSNGDEAQEDTDEEETTLEPGYTKSLPVAAFVEQVYPYADFKVFGFEL